MLDLSSLFEALMTAVEVDGKIQLKDNLHFPVEAHDTLIIRKADRHLFRLFDELILKGKSINENAFDRMVIAGPEGIGKVRCCFRLLLFVRQHIKCTFSSCLELVLHVFLGEVVTEWIYCCL